jgi:hypothetical protein
VLWEITIEKTHTVNLGTKWVSMGEFQYLCWTIRGYSTQLQYVICRDLANSWLTRYKVDKWCKHQIYGNSNPISFKLNRRWFTSAISGTLGMIFDWAKQCFPHL